MNKQNKISDLPYFCKELINLYCLNKLSDYETLQCFNKIADYKPCKNYSNSKIGKCKMQYENSMRKFEAEKRKLLRLYICECNQAYTTIMKKKHIVNEAKKELVRMKPSKEYGNNAEYVSNFFAKCPINSNYFIYHFYFRGERIIEPMITGMQLTDALYSGHKYWKI